jgi:hypothetical protein
VSQTVCAAVQLDLDQQVGANPAFTNDNVIDNSTD